ncbi:nucleoside recognition domain protein [Alkaliphilus metalliredigens QYMF]|uniref:Nucleoside recognition domain protein n=1 Tax=Alkaliphilus metalliredigens (strain QYMF) TaxID=293826 RepID=A6TPY2_ALKMQ|nr:YjiH family protein [Alkaliphilus metalliredigens]ABR48250.1 nucleoside recognition domain protein [Alkaliphilus metalliredigens QYMF]
MNVDSIEKSNLKASFKMIIMSLIGIFSFFINIRIGEESTIFVNHLSNFLTTRLFSILPYIILIISSYCVIDIIRNRSNYNRSIVVVIFSICKIMGFAFLLFTMVGVGPEFLLDESIGVFVLYKLLIPITINIPVAALFLPFLLDYGFVDFIGILLQKIMRPLFKCPGKSAIIAVTAFLGNFSVGHIAVDSMYKEGKLTEKEAVIMGTGFCTCSIGFLMVLANTLNIMEYWTFYFWSSLTITFFVTFISIRLWPLNKKESKYHAEVVPQPEHEFKSNLIKNAYATGLAVAERAEPIQKRLCFILRESYKILSGLLCGAMFFASIGLYINQTSSFFTYLGYIHYPFLKLVNIPDIKIAMEASGISILDLFLPAVIAAEQGAALETRYLIAVMPVSMIIFFAGFIPCILSTQIPIKFIELIALWIQRTILTIIFAGTIAMLYF